MSPIAVASFPGELEPRTASYGCVYVVNPVPETTRSYDPSSSQPSIRPFASVKIGLADVVPPVSAAYTVAAPAARRLTCTEAPDTGAPFELRTTSGISTRGAATRPSPDLSPSDTR